MLGCDVEMLNVAVFFSKCLHLLAFIIFSGLLEIIFSFCRCVVGFRNSFDPVISEGFRIALSGGMVLNLCDLLSQCRLGRSVSQTPLESMAWFCLRCFFF